MKKIAAVIQIVIVLLLVGYSTWHLYAGNFTQSMAILPILAGYYLYLVSRQKKNDSLPGERGKHT